MPTGPACGGGEIPAPLRRVVFFAAVGLVRCGAASGCARGARVRLERLAGGAPVNGACVTSGTRGASAAAELPCRRVQALLTHRFSLRAARFALRPWDTNDQTACAIADNLMVEIEVAVQLARPPRGKVHPVHAHVRCSAYTLSKSPSSLFLKSHNGTHSFLCRSNRSIL